MVLLGASVHAQIVISTDTTYSTHQGSNNANVAWMVTSGATLTIAPGGFIGQPDRSVSPQVVLRLGTTDGIESGHLVMNGGEIDGYESGGNNLWGVEAYGSSTFTMNGGLLDVNETGNGTTTNSVGFLAYDDSTVTLNGGVLEVTGDATGSIFPFVASDNARVDIHGGKWVLGANVGFVVMDSAVVTIYGWGFNRPDGVISDNTGTITGTLDNGDPFNLKFDRSGGGTIVIVSVDATLPADGNMTNSVIPSLTMQNNTTLTINEGGSLVQNDSTGNQVVLRLGTTNGTQSGHLVMNGGLIYGVELGGSDLWGIEVYGSSTFTMNGGLLDVNEIGNPVDTNRNAVGFLAYDDSTVRLNRGVFEVTGDGAGDIVPFVASNNACVDIYGGVWSLPNGSVGFVVKDSATVNIFGMGFNHPYGSITNLAGTITGTLANGDAFNLKFDRSGGGAIFIKSVIRGTCVRVL
jgi:hypothetical protein